MDSSASSEPADGLKERVGRGLQRGDPVRTHERILIALLVVAVGVAFLALFSGLPYAYGDEIFRRLSESFEYSLYSLAGAAVLAVTLYVFDVRYWRGFWRVLGGVLICVSLAGFAAAALLATREYPVAPIGLFLFGAPVLFVGLRELLFAHIDIVDFLQSLQLGIWVGALGSLAIWMGYIVTEDKYWEVETKAEYYRRMRCALEPSALENATSVNIVVQDLQEDFVGSLSDAQLRRLDEALVGCTGAFLLWLLPFILFAWGTVFSGSLYFMIRTLKQARAASSRSKALDPLAQAFLMFTGLGLLGLWAAAGIAGAEMDLTNVVLALAFLFMILCGLTATAVFGWAEIRGSLTGSPLGVRLVAAMQSDWMRAIMLMLVAPFFIFYLMLSFLTQLARKYLGCTKTLKPEYRRLWVTHSASELLRSVLNWNWTSVLVKSHYVGILFFVFAVGVARLTTLFLSWLNEALVPVPLFATTIIFIVVGLLMFAAPPIPGVPVYLAGGIILVASAEPTLGYWPATAFTIAICFGLKLSAIVLQQKLFGERLASHRVWIRQAVGINSVEIRAIRDILLKPGLDIRKVAILCGGPDWPTSVLTGILRLSLPQMLLGSLPVFFLIAPTVLAAALLLRADEGGAWGSVSTMALAVTVLVQSGAMLAAIHFIAKTVVEKEAELRALPDDEEVLALEKAQARRVAVSRAVSDWRRLPAVQRAALSVSAAAMTASCYVFQLLGSRCFESFGVDDSIEERLGGNAVNLVKPLGWGALALFAAPCFVLAAFNRIAAAKTRAAMRDPSHWAHTQVQELGFAAPEPDELKDDDVDERAVGKRILCRAYCLPCLK